jgi:hypothetical protein
VSEALTLLMQWLLPPRRPDGSELRAIERIAEARRQKGDEIWADPRIVCRIIEGRGRDSGKLYGYMAPQERSESHVTSFRPRAGGMTREVGR